MKKDHKMKKLCMISTFIIIQLCISCIFIFAATPQNNNKQTSINNKTVRTFLDKIEIYGRIAKPQTVFIIPGADPRVDGIRIERRFFSDIFRKVEKSTLRKQKKKEQRNKDHLLW